MFLKRKIFVTVSLLIYICIIAALTSVNILPLPTSTNVIAKPKIILDAGHAGFS